MSGTRDDFNCSEANEAQFKFRGRRVCGAFEVNIMVIRGGLGIQD